MLRLACMLLTLGAEPAAPPSSKVPVTDTLHGHQIVDAYRWLEDGKSPATRQWIASQNRHTNQVLGQRTEREAIRSRLTQLLRIDVVTVPVFRGGRYFYSRRRADQEQAILYFRDDDAGTEQVLVDPHPLSADQTTSVSLLDVSPDGGLVAYGLRSGGADEMEVRFLEVSPRRELPDRLPTGRYFGVQLRHDNKGVFFARHDAAGSKVWQQPFGKSETLVFDGRFGPGVLVSPSLSNDGKTILLSANFGSAADKTELYIAPVDGGPAKPLVTGIPARFQGEIAGGQLYVHTNWKAPSGRVLRIDLANPGAENWREIVPAGPDAIEDIALVGGKILVHQIHDVHSAIRVVSADGKQVQEIALPGIGSARSFSGQWESPEVFFEFNSFIHPPEIRRLDANNGQQSVWSKIEVPIATDRIEIVQKRIRSKDGTLIPVFLVQPKGSSPGPRPTLLTGYGGFNISLTPTYSPVAAFWAESGGVFALANLRGGGEFGEAWHQAGMRDKKQNVFDDFLAVASWLIDNQITTPDKLAVMGRSNGGLLVGAALTQRPELFRAVVCGYPLLDMLRYHRFLVARFWVPEYGSSEDPAQFETLFRYSPYHHVRPGVRYPAVLLVTGDADTRVDPLHARKTAALLQEHQSPGRPVLLHYDTQAGHSAGRPVRQVIDDLATEMTFLFWQLGMKPERQEPGASAALHRLFEREWQWHLKEHPTQASSLGDRRYNDRWPDEALADIDRRHAHRALVLKELDRIPVGELSPADRLNYRLFRQAFEAAVAGHPFRLELVAINQREGVQTADELADALRFETTKDYEDWLARLERFPIYVRQQIDLLREGIRTRRVHPKIIMQRLPKQLQAQLVDAPEKSSFYKPFREISSAVPAPTADELRNRARRAVSQKVIPALRELDTFLQGEYLPACSDGIGIWQWPEGKAAYAYLARYFTTTRKTPEEIHAIGLAEVSRIRKEMERVLEQVHFTGGFAKFLDHLRTDSRFYYTSGDDLLAGYRALSKRIDPSLVRLFGKLPRMPYGVEPVPMAVAPDTTTAYYRPPAADGSRAGTFFVNLYRPETRPKYEMEALALHEAVPGHHLQIALAMESPGLPAFRRYRLTDYTAFVEGWGLYAESLGTDLGLYKDPYSYFGRLTYEIWRAIRLVVDTGMHSKGWTRERAIDFFRQNAAKSELDIINEVDRYIAWPGQALAYKIGEMQIQQLRQRARERLGSRWDIRRFHDAVLALGPVPLDVLEESIDAWISEEKNR